MLKELQSTCSKATPLGKALIRKSKIPLNDQRVESKQRSAWRLLRRLFFLLVEQRNLLPTRMKK